MKDHEGKSLSQAITAISLCSLEPPNIDSEIFSECVKLEPSKKQTRQKKKSKIAMRSGYEEVAPSDSSSSESSNCESSA